MADLEQLRRIFQRTARKPRIHSIVVGLTAPGVEFRAAEGHADGIKRTPMTEDTPYFLASITKLFTSVVTMTLARDGRLDMDAPLSSFLPEGLIRGLHVLDGIDRSGLITPHQLLSQTSGLADYFGGTPKGGRSLEAELMAGSDRELSLADKLDIVHALEPEFEPGAGNGTRAFYSDTNFQLLAAVIEAVTETSIVDVFHDLIFSPLDLSHTYIFDHTVSRPAPAVLWNGRRSVHIPLAMSSFDPDGGGVTTVTDALRFLRAVFEGELLTADEIRMMTSRWNRVFFPFHYGVGLQRFTLPRIMSPHPPPPTLIGHAGSTGSFSFYEPSKQAYIVGTANQTDNPGRPYRMIVQMMHALR